MNVILNLDGYNSILYSGLLSYLTKQTQNLIKRLYERIRLHNEYLLYRRRYEDIFFLYDQSMGRYGLWLTRAAHYNSALMLYENEIKALIPNVEKSIDKERIRSTV